MSGIWTEHRNAEGRTYWFNTSTKESVWEKPDVLKTPFEKALAETKWKEYFSGGRKYYYNTETKESKWDMPDELLLLLEKVEKETKPSQELVNPRLMPPNFAPAAVPIGNADSLAGGAALPITPTPSSGALPGRANLPDDPVIPHNGFATIEEGERAFVHLLKKAGVDATWTWDQTMRAIITDPLYKALNSLAEKKNCWQKYVDGLKEKEREEREARLARIRPAVRNMLKGNPNVFHYTTFATADRLFAQHPIWQQAKIDSERKMIFEEYVAELKQREIQESRALRTRSIAKVVSMFKELNVDVLTRWRTAYNALLESEAWANDSELERLPALDILLAFEDYARVQEREFEDRMRRESVEKTRKERKAREAFKELLKELVDQGKIKARTKWKDVYPEFEEDQRYLDLLGKPGSNPIELFWDLVDGFDQKLDAKISIVNDAFKKLGWDSGKEQPFEVKPETTDEEFYNVCKEARKLDSDSEFNNLNDDDLKEVLDILRSESAKRLESDRRRTERKQRHLQDDLRYALKKLSEPIDVNMSYEDAVPLIQTLPEFQALEDEGRRAAFSKFIKRQKERLKERELSEDGGSTTSRRRKEPVGKEREDRERERERERGHEKEKEREYREEERSSSKHHKRGHDSDYEKLREREYRDKEREYRERDKDRDRERDGYRSRYRERDREYERERGGERSRDGRERERERERDRERERERHRGSRAGEDVRYSYGFEERSGEKRERERERDDRSVFSDRSEKRARYESESTMESVNGGDVKKAMKREETPEEGEI